MSHNPFPAEPHKNLHVDAESDYVPQPSLERDHRHSQLTVKPEREPVRQALFQRKSNAALKLPNGYVKVAVLIIRWDHSIDGFEGHTEEVSTMRNGTQASRLQTGVD